MIDKIDLREQPILCRGILYKSQSEFARAMGVTPTTISQALKRGTLENVGTRASGRPRKPVEVDGVKYGSMTEAGKSLGIAHRALMRRIKSNKDSQNE